MFGAFEEPHIMAIKHGFLTEIPSNKSFIFYDIETTLCKQNELIGNSIKTFSHKLVSIAANSYVNSEQTQKFLRVDDSSENEQQNIITKFSNFVKQKL